MSIQPVIEMTIATLWLGCSMMWWPHIQGGTETFLMRHRLEYHWRYDLYKTLFLVFSPVLTVLYFVWLFNRRED